MEQEKHLNEQGQSKFFTRSAARHLRRKRLKDARRAEKQLLEIINGVNDDSDKQANVTTENKRAEEIQLKSLSFNSQDLPNLLQASDSLNSSKTPIKVQKKYINHEHIIESNQKQDLNVDIPTENHNKRNHSDIDQTNLTVVNIDSEDHSTQLPRSPALSKELEREIRVSQICQTRNDDNESTKSPVTIVILKDNLSNTSICSTSDISDCNTNCISFGSKTSNVAMSSDLNLNSIENENNLKLCDISSTGVDNLIQNNTEVTNGVITDAADQFVNYTPSDNKKSVHIESGKIRQSSLKSKLLTKNMADNKPNCSEKTREEIKTEREAKKAAKAAAKAKGKNNAIAGPENIKSDSSLANCEALKKNVKTDIVDGQNLHLVKETSKENIISSSNITKDDVISGEKNEEKSKAELRAERRAKQEAQRAAKQQKSLPKTKSQESVKIHINTSSECPIKKSVKSVRKENVNDVSLFKHLCPKQNVLPFKSTAVNSHIHPAIIRLGVKYADRIIVGSNARCVAFLIAIKQVIEDFQKPAQADFNRALQATLQESMTYLHNCRPAAVTMQNALGHLKWQMSQFSSVLSEEDGKAKLKKVIDTYILEQIELAGKAISLKIQSKISNGDVILTYGHSSLIQKILLDAHAAGKQFRLIIVDGRPRLEGKEHLRRLMKCGIECSYILINALSFIMPQVNKVFIGAHAILANGVVMSRVGTAQLAVTAKAYNVPVLVACEIHKACERVMTDSISCNETGNANDLIRCPSNSKKSLLSNWRMKKFINLLNWTYDVTPARLITAVVTELAILPCTSVPVILRIKPAEI